MKLTNIRLSEVSPTVLSVASHLYKMLISGNGLRSMVAWGGHGGGGLSEQGHEGMFWGKGNVYLDWGDRTHLLNSLTTNVFSCV